MQQAISNSTTTVSGNITNPSGNPIINSSKIQEYTFSAPKDTVIDIVINYTTNLTQFTYLGESNSMKQSGDDQLYGLEWDGTYWYYVGQQYDTVYQYDEDFVYTGWSKSLSSQDGNPQGIKWDGTNWWMLGGNNDKIYKYSSSWVYTGDSYSVASDCHSFEFDGTYWYVAYGDSFTDDHIRKYDSSFNSLGNVATVSGEDYCAHITWYDDCFYTGGWNGKIYRWDSDWNKILEYDPYGGYVYAFDYNENDLYWWVRLGTGGGVYKHIFYTEDLSTMDVEIANFTYRKLGIDYTESHNVSIDDTRRIINDFYNVNGTWYYSFGSTYFNEYNYVNDITVLEQNITVLISKFSSGFDEIQFNYSLWINYSSDNEWKVPSEIFLSVNNEYVDDETFNSGSVSLDDFPETITISSSESNIYLKINITSQFKFEFGLDVISKTYLRKYFELESDHQIYITTITLDSDLSIKKIYLNNEDLGSSNPNTISPAESMDPSNEFKLEVLINEEIYLPLRYLTNSLGTGTSSFLMLGTSNTLIYNNIDEDYNFDPILPSGMNVVSADFNFPDLYYTPYYISNESENVNDYGYSNQTYGDEQVEWSQEYYQTNQNGSYVSEQNDPYYYYRTSVPNNDSFVMINGTHTQNGSLYDIDGDYGEFSSSVGASSGTYPATYSFTSDADGSNPSGWSVDESGGTVNVIASESAHSKVLEIHDTSGSYVLALQEFSAQSYGTIEFWIRSDDVSDPCYAFLRSSGTHVCAVGLDAEYVRVTDSGSWTNVVAASDNTWYRIRLDFECTAGGYQGLSQYDFHIYINDIEYGDYDFANNLGSINQFRAETTAGDSNYYYYLDAVGYSWDSGYNIGDNKYSLSSDCLLNFTSEFYINNNTLDVNDSINSITLYYSHKSNESAEVSFYLYNFDLNQFDLINNSDNYDAFYDNSFVLNSSYYNNSNYARLQYFANETSEYELYLDQFCLIVNISTYDIDFDSISSLWIADTIVVSHQELILFFQSYDKNISYLEIRQIYDSITTTIFNITLQNNTLQSISFYNISAGFYQFDFYFYNDYGNYEKWTLNFTIIPTISISVGYQNPQIIGLSNTVNVNVQTEYSINEVYYDNSTNYFHMYSNSSYPLYDYEFNFTISYSISINYNISILVIGEYNDTFWVNVTNLCFIQSVAVMEFNNFYAAYYQDDKIEVLSYLKDMFNQPINNKLINYTIEAPNSTIIIDSSAYTNSSGAIEIQFQFSTSFDVGFYHLNVSFNGTIDYTSVWKLQSFEILPISRSVSAPDINMTINGFVLTSNSIQINNSNTFDIECLDNSTFDMQVQYTLNYTENISYDETFDYEYDFSATSTILSYTITFANITDYPANFTDYYVDSLASTNYVAVGSQFNCLDLIGDTLYNSNDFTISFRYIEDDNIQRVQITTTPTTESNSVIFREYLYANRTFGYWYVPNSYDINTLSLYHVRTGTTIAYADFEIESNKYYFEKSCQDGDQFTATIDYQWNPAYNYTIDINNGTYAQITITYSADLTVENASLVINLLSDDCYMENWASSGSQSSSTYKLTIPDINFNTTSQTLIITGNSSVPYAQITNVENEDGFEISDSNYDDLEEWFEGYLTFTKYSKSWIISNIETDWTLDGVHYSGYSYDITTEGLFTSSGWGTGISSAYLRFEGNTISDFKREQKKGYVKYTIISDYDLDDIDFKFYIESNERINYATMIKELKKEIDCLEIVGPDIVEDEDGTKKYYFVILEMDLESGTNVIEIEYEPVNIGVFVGFFGIFGVIMISSVLLYLSYQNKDQEKFQWINLFKFWKKGWFTLVKRELLFWRNK